MLMESKVLFYKATVLFKIFPLDVSRGRINLSILNRQFKGDVGVGVWWRFLGWVYTDSSW